MKKGFTLIELLVVISIISLLSSVVLASLKSARLKAADSAIKQNMVSLRNQAAIYFSDNGNYGADYFSGGGFPPIYISNCTQAFGTMFADSKIAEFITAAGAIASGQTGATAMSYAICGARSPSGSTQASWMVAVPLKSAPQLNLFSGIPGAVRGWCVDSAGNSKLISSALPQAPTQCP